MEAGPYAGQLTRAALDASSNSPKRDSNTSSSPLPPPPIAATLPGAGSPPSPEAPRPDRSGVKRLDRSGLKRLDRSAFTWPLPREGGSRARPPPPLRGGGEACAGGGVRAPGSICGGAGRVRAGRTLCRGTSHIKYPGHCAGVPHIRSTPDTVQGYLTYEVPRTLCRGTSLWRGGSGRAGPTLHQGKPEIAPPFWCRGTSLIGKRNPLGPYRRPVPRVLGES